MPTLGTASSYSFNAVSDSRAVSVDVGSNLLLVAIQERFNRGEPTVTYNGSSLTSLISGGINSGSLNATYIFYLVSPSTGSHTLAISGLSTNVATVVGVLPVSGANTSAPFRSQGANNYLSSTGNPGTNSTLTPTTASGDLVVSVCGIEDATDETLTAGLTSSWNVRQTDGGGANGIRSGGQTTTASGSSTGATWTFASRNNVHVALSLVPSATNVSATAVPAIATAALPALTVTVAVGAPTATATAAAPSPTLSAGLGTQVTVVAAAATADALIPDISLSVTTTVAAATASALAPSVSISADIILPLPVHLLGTELLTVHPSGSLDLDART